MKKTFKNCLSLLLMLTMVFSVLGMVPVMADEPEESEIPEEQLMLMMAAAEEEAEKEKVVEIDGQYFASIYEALDFIQPRETATIKLLDDITITADQRMFTNYSIVINAEYITLDLNGKTLTFDYEGSTQECFASIAIYNQGTLTITDTSEEKNGTIYNKTLIQNNEGPRILWVTSAGVATIEAGRFISEQAHTMFYTSNSNKDIPTCFYIKGGYFKHTVPTENGKYRYFNKQNGYQRQIIEISGGTFAHNPTDAELDKCYYVVENEDGTWGVVYTWNAKVGYNGYETLAEAITAANAVEDGATVTLLDNVTLGEKLTITGNVTISGEYTITRADDYTGTLFAVNADATLTLDGGLVIDGANEYVFDAELYAADAADWNTPIAKEDSAKWFTPEEGAPVATAFMITTTGGTVNLNKVTIQNNYSVGSGVISAGAGATITLNGAKITHIAATQGTGVAVSASGADIKVTMNEGTVIDGNHVGGNHGIFKIYSGTVFTMNGGAITNNTGWNSNGVVVGVYWGTFNMNGGLICSNTGVYGPSNGRNAAVYLHSGHQFTMTGGQICHNSGRARGGIDAPYDNGTAIITGGAVIDNISRGNGAEYDVLGTSAMEIFGGTFTQDVSKYLAPDRGLVYDEGNGQYSVVTEGIAEVNGTAYDSLREAVDAAEDGDIVKVLASHKIGDQFEINKDIILNLNGTTIRGNFIVPEAELTILNGSIVNSNSSYSAIEINAGKLTLEDVNIKSARHAVRIDGDVEAVIDGGIYKLSVVEGQTQHVVNVSGAANVAIKDGTFVGPQGTTADSGAAVNVQSDATVTIEGGSFSGGKNNTLSVAGTLVLTGGTYDQDPAAYVAEGYTVEEDTENSLYTVVMCAVMVEYSDETIAYFNTLADAVASIEKDATTAEAPAVITLLEDVKLAGPQFVGKSYVQHIVLDLNGYKLSSKDTSLIAYRSGSTLTVKNGTVHGNSSAGGSVKVANQGTMILENVTITANSTAIVIESGTLVIAEPTVKVEGGKTDIIVNDLDASNIKISAGTFNHPVEYEYCVEGYVSHDNGDGTYTVAPAPVKVEGGRYYATLADAVASVEKGATTAEDPAVITLLEDVKLAGPQFVGKSYVQHIVLDLNGYKLSSNATTLIAYRGGSTLTVVNGTVHGNSSSGGSVKATYNGTLILGEDVIVTANSTAILVDGGSLVIEEPSVKVQSGKTDILAKNQSESNTITITAGTFNHDVTEFCAEGYVCVENEDGTWTVEKASKQITVTFDNLTMVAGNELPEFTYTTNFTEVSEDGTMLVVEEPAVEVNGAGEYEITANAYVFMNDTYVVTVVSGMLKVLEAVSEVDGVYYATFEDALANADEGDTVVLEAGCEADDIIIPAGVTLDLNGYTLIAETVTGEAGSNLIDSSEENTGKLICDEVTLAEDNAQLPVYVEDGYIFFDLADEEDWAELIELLEENGSEALELEVFVKWTWTWMKKEYEYFYKCDDKMIIKPADEDDDEIVEDDVVIEDDEAAEEDMQKWFDKYKNGFFGWTPSYGSNTDWSDLWFGWSQMWGNQWGNMYQADYDIILSSGTGVKSVAVLCEA